MKKLLCIFGLLWSVSSFAQAPNPADVAREQNRIQQQQRQLMDDQLRQRELQAAESQSPYRTGQAGRQDAAQTPEKPAGRCVEIKQIVFAGNTILSDRAIRRITRVYEGRCLHAEEINAMLNDITNACIERGYATCRAFMEMPQTRLED